MTRLAADLMAARIRVVRSPKIVAQMAAERLADAATTGMYERGWGSLALSGGRTPTATLTELSRHDLKWAQVCVTLVDERWVEPGSSDSNQRLIEDQLLTGPAQRCRFVPMKTSAISPLAGIGSQVQTMHTLPLPFDGVLLGMGEDGHFASLFPHSRALRDGLNLDSPSSCVAVDQGEQGAPPALPRMSLTLATIAKARKIILLTSGSAKLRVLERAIREICNPAELPIAALLAARPDATILHCPT
jgi:6-phosphogluconolactonase